MRRLALLLAGSVAIACHDPVRNTDTTARPEPFLEIPPSAGIATRPCGDGTTYFTMTALANRERWYGAHLRALGEHPICDRTGAPTDVYRLTWLPTFHPTVVVRIERSDSGDIFTAKAVSGAGGYEPGHLARDTTYTLKEADSREFVRLLNEADFWAMPTTPPSDGTIGLDGAQWVLEGMGRGRYHVVDRWSPRANGPDAAYRRLAEWMLGQSGFTAASLVRGY